MNKEVAQALKHVWKRYLKDLCIAMLLMIVLCWFGYITGSLLSRWERENIVVEELFRDCP